MASDSAIKVQVKIIGANDPASPPLVLQVTQMVNTYMLWIGAVENISDIGAGENAVLSGNLCKDWACAMPATIVRDSVASETRAKAFAVAIAGQDARSDKLVSIVEFGRLFIDGTAFR